MSKPTQDRIRRVLLESLPADPKWAVWVEGVVEELAGSPMEDPRLTQIRALHRRTEDPTHRSDDEALFECEECGQEWPCATAAVLDAVSVDATPAQGTARDALMARLQSINWGNSATRIDRDRFWGECADAVLAVVRPVEGACVRCGHTDPGFEQYGHACLPVEGIVLSPEEAEATRAALAVSLETEPWSEPIASTLRDLAGRLEASS